jgi:hypothetical protein
MLYADEPYFRKPPRIDEQFGVGRKYKDSNCPWRMYFTPNITGIWEIRTNPLKHSNFGSATRADHNQMTSRMITDIVKNRLRDNLEMIVKEARCLVK